jgi:hypothetical protein
MHHLILSWLKSLPRLLGWAFLSLGAVLLMRLLRGRLEHIARDLEAARLRRDDGPKPTRLERDPATGIYRPASGQ